MERNSIKMGDTDDGKKALLIWYFHFQPCLTRLNLLCCKYQIFPNIHLLIFMDSFLMHQWIDSYNFISRIGEIIMAFNSPPWNKWTRIFSIRSLSSRTTWTHEIEKEKSQLLRIHDDIKREVTNLKKWSKLKNDLI